MKYDISEHDIPEFLKVGSVCAFSDHSTEDTYKIITGDSLLERQSPWKMPLVQLIVT